MGEQIDSEIRDQDESAAASGERLKDYEPPTLTDFGTVAERTGQQLKTSGSADFVNFRPSS